MFNHPPIKRRIVVQEEKLELQPEFDLKLAKRIKLAGKTGELNFMMEGLNYFPMGVFQEEVRSDGLPRGNQALFKRAGSFDKGVSSRR